MGFRITIPWIVGPVLVLGSFNHAIVGVVEMFYGLRFGGPIGWNELFANLGIAIAGNLVGGLVVVTFVRSAQVFGSKSGYPQRAPAGSKLAASNETPSSTSSRWRRCVSTP